MTAQLALAIALLVAVSLCRAGRQRRQPRHQLRGRRRHSLLYRTYLRSPLWRIRRRVWIAQAFGRCQGCGRFRRMLTIHHLTYARLGHERRDDVKVLCWSCHRRRHTNDRLRPEPQRRISGWS
jgi:hypothetical protein